MRGMWVALVLLAAGCAAEQKTPGWLSTVPASTQELCAIGVSGPTYYLEDARARSQASAMTELARTIEVRVKTDMVLKSEG
ncbi:MAG: hypothetical protein HY348_16340, partial [Nitrospira defluvii]|nr:hypothetical protein [Nitrospira defluvii]